MCPMCHRAFDGNETRLACYALNVWSVDEGRLDNCPMGEVKTPHGRLIDESVVLEMIRKDMGIKSLEFLYNAEKSVVNQIIHSPTVIDAEVED